MRSATLTHGTHKVLAAHLLQHARDEDLCFALYRPSTGAARTTAIVSGPIMPRDGEREVHGNASFSGEYFQRAAQIARANDAGLVFVHSHTRRSRGWQGMSPDDVDAETKYAPRAHAMTGLPLVGMTIAGDGAWSARFWEKTSPRDFRRVWCENVRVVGNGPLTVTYHDHLRPRPAFREVLKRTISAWGPDTQADLARLRIGIIGAGNVGAIIGEALARIGIEHIRLIDFDTVKEVNLDRLLHASEFDAYLARAKVFTLARALRRSSTAGSPTIDAFECSVVEEDGFLAALDCDVIFSCVDRPLPRSILNFIAYAHHIPVVDGGIAVRTTGDRLTSARWRAHIAAPERRCLECLGQYDPALVSVERQGQLDDPHYLKGLPPGHSILANENVFAFGLGAASLEVLQLLLSVTGLGRGDIGAQEYTMETGTVDIETRDCEPTCIYTHNWAGLGDATPASVTGRHPVAERERQARVTVGRKPRIRLLRRTDDMLAALRDRLEGLGR